jgi:hypothetical protein
MNPIYLQIKLPAFQDQPKQNNFPVNFFSLEELEQSFYFIENYVHLGLDGARNFILKMTLNSKKFLNEYLLYHLEQLPKNLEFLIVSGEFKRKKRRNEEINKKLYKGVLKRLKGQFNRKHCDIVTKSMGTKLEKYFRNPTVGFYVWMFESTIKKNHEYIDFIIDVCLENYGIKCKNFTKEMGWKINKKYKAMKNISATFRYLLKCDIPCRNKFVEYFQSSDEDGLVANFEKKIRRNLKEKLNLLKSELFAVGGNFNRFILKFRNIIMDKNYKNPWLMQTIKRSISYCVIELTHEYSEAKKKGKYRDISKEYKKMKDLHYTSFE